MYVSKPISVYKNPLYSTVKEYIEDRRIKNLKKKHDLIVKKTIEYLVNREYLLGNIVPCSDYVIDHGFRPDIYYVNDILLLGEIKIMSKNIQGPQQLRIYLNELFSQGVSREERIGVLSYGRIYEGDLNFIRENVELLNLDKEFNMIYILDFHGDLRREPSVVVIS